MLFTQRNLNRHCVIQTHYLDYRRDMGNGLYNYGRSYVFYPLYFVPQRIINTAKGVYNPPSVIKVNFL